VDKFMDLKQTMIGAFDGAEGEGREGRGVELLWGVLGID